LISREEVLENAFKIYTHECGLLEVVGVATIETLPSVNPQTGHWIEHPEIETSTPEYLMFYECSECGDKQCFCKSDIHKKHFCNNCGTRMINPNMSENPTGSEPQETKPEISSYYGLKSYVRERSDKE
jgi:hypothetical protein